MLYTGNWLFSNILIDVQETSSKQEQLFILKNLNWLLPFSTVFVTV